MHICPNVPLAATDRHNCPNGPLEQLCKWPSLNCAGGAIPTQPPVTCEFGRLRPTPPRTSRAPNSSTWPTIRAQRPRDRWPLSDFSREPPQFGLCCLGCVPRSTGLRWGTARSAQASIWSPVAHCFFFRFALAHKGRKGSLCGSAEQVQVRVQFSWYFSPIWAKNCA